MRWNAEEIEKLSPILEQMRVDLEPLNGKSVLVLCSAAGDVAFWLGERMKNGSVVGLELSDELLKTATIRVKEKGLDSLVKFQKAEKDRIPFPDETFDALVSEFIIFPTSVPTQIGQPEMARVLKPGGTMILTDVIVTKPLSEEKSAAFQAIGLDYLCEGTQDEFRNWMEDAGLINVDILDFTPVVRRVWKQRQDRAVTSQQQKAYSILLEDPEFGLGKAIFYIYVRGNTFQAGARRTLNNPCYDFFSSSLFSS